MRIVQRTAPSLLTTLFVFMLVGACDGTKADAEASKPAPRGVDAPASSANEPADAPDAAVARAAKIALEIEANPEDADEILTRYSLDRDGFERMIKEIARDPQKSSDYEVLLMGT